MQLSPNERAILAYFISMDAAQKAAKILRKSGFKHLRVDRVAHHVGTKCETERILLSSDPSASGIADSRDNHGKPFILTLVTTESKIKDAEKIVEQFGGSHGLLH